MTSSTPSVTTGHLPPPRGYWFDEDAAAHAAEFFQLLVHTKGRWAGVAFTLLEWQLEEVIRPLFGWKRPDGTRRYRVAYLEVPSKCGKSELGAGLALKLARADKEMGGEVYSAAADKYQARIVFETAKAMVEASPRLRRGAKILRDVIVWGEAISGSVYRVLSADAIYKHGLNVHGFVFDELHAQPNRELWDVLNEMTAARAQPLGIALTTAGTYDPTSICWEQHEYTQRIAEGAVSDPHYLGVIYAADEKQDWAAPETWRAANPSLGVTKTEEYLAERVQKAKALPSYLNTFLRLHLNVWTRQVNRWLALPAWDASAGLVAEEKLAGSKCWVALHLAASTDLAAVVLHFPGEGEHQVLFRFFCPRERLADLDQRTGGQAAGWVRAGQLRVTEGDVIDYRAVVNQLEQDASMFEIQEVAYHRFGMTQLATELADAGLTVVPVSTGIASISPATKEWERLIYEKDYRHGGNPVMRWMVHGIAMKQDAEGNMKVDPERSADTVVGPVAAVIALDRVLRHRPRKQTSELVSF